MLPVCSGLYSVLTLVKSAINVSSDSACVPEITNEVQPVLEVGCKTTCPQTVCLEVSKLGFTSARFIEFIFYLLIIVSMRFQTSQGTTLSCGVFFFYGFLSVVYGSLKGQLLLQPFL